jgi:hypothetical protein
MYDVTIYIHDDRRFGDVAILPNEISLRVLTAYSEVRIFNISIRLHEVIVIVDFSNPLLRLKSNMLCMSGIKKRGKRVTNRMFLQKSTKRF